MSTPVHFDVAAVLAEHERMVAQMEATDPADAGVQIQARIARLATRGYLALLVGERNRGTSPELVIGATAAAIANIIPMMHDNFPEADTVRVFSETLQRAEQVSEGMRSYATVPGTRGGNA